MVVLSASICTRGGKALLSRQFREISRDRITELLANFPSLISQGSQQTTAEDDSVRYVFQPLEEFYVVLITNKSSNILQDIDTLHLFASAISSLLRNVDEREVFDNAFELISAFDEIINLGYKEKTTLSQIQTFLAMESYEETIHDNIERNKVVVANEEKKRKAKDIQRRELAMREGRKIIDDLNHGLHPPTPTYPSTTMESQEPLLPSTPAVPRGGGLQLGQKRAPKAPAAAAAGAAATARSMPVAAAPVVAKPAAPKTPNNGILITISEKISAQLSRDGAVEESEVKGELQLRINKEELARARILLQRGQGVQYKPHPNVDKQLFNSQGVVGLKDASKAFPSNDVGISVLKWRATASKEDKSLVPVLLTPWASQTDAGTQVTMEYELNPEVETRLRGLGDVSLKILVPVHADVDLADAENVSYEVADYGVVFSVDVASPEELAGSFDFTVAADEESLFPMQVQFEASGVVNGGDDVALAKMCVLDVTGTDDEGLPFDVRYGLGSEGYEVV